ncbi:hypothetical protein ACFQJ7_12515 [Halovenus rubra]|uniref:Uncharacterized protein n=2 Tax=Halovenus rubra TaxID=869890 RepID=A0ACC7E0J6_9EURY|nr:hypothetical protein [Halovenus rubra]
MFEIHTDRINYRKELRRAADITLSNHLETQATFKITIDPASSSEPPVYDRIQLPAGDFVGFTDIFTIGNEYEVEVEANGTTKSENHLASSTNSITITLNQDGMKIGESEN